ncbi:MAG: extracellular solute-binding protein [Clostridia bacterium]|nr:extracellular solute-binding protein [Clostridia bacterium]
MSGKRLIRCVAVVLAVLLSAMQIVPNAVSADNSDVNNNEAASVAISNSSVDDYDVYSSKNISAAKPENEIVLNSALESANTKIQFAEGRYGAVLSEEQRKVTYKFPVNKPGLYNIEISYYAVSQKSKDIVFSLTIDGNLPFSEAESISLARVYEDAGEIKQDGNGNDMRPTQKEVKRWNKALLYDTDGYYNDAYAFAFTEKKDYTLSLSYSEESMLIAGVTLKPVKALISYEEYSCGAEASGEYIKLYEAEQSFEKSSSMLYPTYDRSGPATSPSHYSKIRYNTIGQSNWSQQGQWISWKINVPDNGWYSIAFKARQNYQQGVNSYRTLAIDGEVPFAEAENIRFNYDLNWYTKSIGADNGSPYLFYLSKGEHTLSLTVSAGPMGSVLKSLNDNVLALNGLYRSIIMVTGTTPDKYRTYYLEESVPGLLEDMAAVKESLDKLYKNITEITGASGSQASVILEMAVMLEEFLKKPLSIPTRVSAFKDTIGSLGSLILTLSAQPLELDYIAVYSQSQLPSTKASFWDGLVYGVKGFIASFVEDYNSIGSAIENGNVSKGITVWLSHGRDQAQILKNLIDNKFTPESGIGVSLSIVSTAAGTSSSPLVQATLAGKGPDVALFTPKDTPVNLAMRGALTDVSKLDGFKDIYSEFYESAWIPYIYQGGIYGVPETQNFDMLFYRTDIFEELNLAVPNTWEEFYTVIEILQKNNLGVGVLETNSLNAGISSGISFFEKLLLQNGGTYYNENFTATAFNTQVAYDAFTAWTDLYTEYGLDRSFDFFNRFRTGEMPIGIMSYLTYNQLYAAAPEIRGLWAMTNIPGTVKDGSINRTETAAGTAAVILEDCKKKDAAWEFIKWWTGADAQASFGTELEASLGVAARYDTANIKAFDSIGWADSEADILKEQWASVTDIHQIPGNYFISRCLTNAFRTVADEEENPIRSLNIYNKDMNAEITRKRAEFHLD